MIWQVYSGSDGWFVARETYEGLHEWPSERRLNKTEAERLASALNAKEAEREVGK